MREGVPVVTYPLQRSLRGIWIEKCDAFRCLDESVEVDESQITLKNTELTGSSYIYKGEQYQLSVPGEYQVYNSAVAVETAKLLKKMGHGLKKVNIARGIKNTVWEGRFQVVDTQPLTIVDGAHNPGGWRALRDSIETYLSDRDIIYVCGVFKDKDYLYMLNRMLPGAKEFIALTPPGPRGLSAEVLADKAKEYIGSTYVSESGAQAMDLAKKLSQKYDNPAIVVFGSLSFIGPIIELEEACHRGDREMEREVKTRCDSSRKRADKATCDGSMERGDKARCDGSRKRADKVRCDGSMERADKVRCDSEYKALMNSIEMKEQERVFCRHGMSHVLDVARIAYILCLEEKLNLKKDVVYATALLHDIGRADVESTGKGHHIKSAEKAAEILARCDFESEEIDEICHAIERHNTDGDSHKGLSYALYKADKLSRNCYDCKAWDECYWNEDKKNKNLLI
jgi:dihydrofolate synthase/folylpolyglutamate synthase